MKRMGKYGESVGKFMLSVGDFNKELTPKKGDSRRLLRIMLESKEKGTTYLFDNFEQFMKDIIRRDYPPVNEQEREELDMFVEYNLIPLLLEVQIAFRFVKREEIENQKKDLLQTQELGEVMMKGTGSQIKSLSQLKRAG